MALYRLNRGQTTIGYSPLAGPLRYLARCSAAYLLALPQMWTEFSADAKVADLLNNRGTNPRARARAFVHNSLVDGFVMDPTIGPAMAGAIAWLFSSNEMLPAQLSDYHMFGYDISFVPRPPDVEGHHSMFNFRAVLNREPDQAFEMLDMMRAAPLPEWRPPPH
jgi:hypothetical protein